MAAADSSDSEEEDLVSYGTALQPLQEGKGPAGAPRASPRAVGAAGREAARGHVPRPLRPSGPGGAARPGPARFGSAPVPVPSEPGALGSVGTGQSRLPLPAALGAPHTAPGGCRPRCCNTLTEQGWPAVCF